MTDHTLVEWTLDTLAANYTPGNTSTSTPVLVDDDDGSVYELDTSTGERTALNRRYKPDTAETNIVTVDPNPDRQESPIGTEYDLKVTDAVSIVVEGIHVDETGEIESPYAFASLYKEVRRALLVERSYPNVTAVGYGDEGYGTTGYGGLFPSVVGIDYHTAVPRNPGRPPEDEQANYFAYSFDLEFQGFEILP